jgi:hypothetical protein
MQDGYQVIGDSWTFEPFSPFHKHKTTHSLTLQIQLLPFTITITFSAKIHRADKMELFVNVTANLFTT